MRKRKSGQPAGTDLDWFVIPIEKIRQWALVVVLLAVAGGVGWFVLLRGRGSPQERARSEIAQADSLLARATRATGAARPGSNTAQAKDFLRDARESFTAAHTGVPASAPTFMVRSLRTSNRRPKRPERI